MERVKGFEPSSSAWKAEVLPLNYTRAYERKRRLLTNALDGGGRRIRTSEAYAADLQSAPFDRSGIPPSGKPPSMKRKNGLVNNQTSRR